MRRAQRPRRHRWRMPGAARSARACPRGCRGAGAKVHFRAPARISRPLRDVRSITARFGLSMMAPALSTRSVPCASSSPLSTRSFTDAHLCAALASILPLMRRLPPSAAMTTCRARTSSPTVRSPILVWKLRDPVTPVWVRRIQTAEILDGLPFQLDAAVFEGHIGAAGIVFAAGAAQLASRDQASRRAHGGRAQAASVVIGGGNVHDRSGRLNDVARLAFQLDIAAPAVTGLVEQRRAAPGHVDARVAQRDVPFGPHAQFAAGQGDGAIQRDAVRDQVQRSADGRGADRLSHDRRSAPAVMRDTEAASPVSSGVRSGRRE